MQDAKPWYLSAGVWGAFVTLLGSALSLLKFRLDPALLDDLRDWVLSLVTLVGGAVALYGRIRATRRLVMAAPPSDGSTKGQNWRMNAAGPLALLLLPAVLAHASGCASLSGPAAAYVAADRATYDAVAPEYADYVRHDPALDEAARARRGRTLETWRLRVEAGEGSAPSAPPAPSAPSAATDVTDAPAPLPASDPARDVMPDRELTPDRDVTGEE
jgi:hypothetical protein